MRVDAWVTVLNIQGLITTKPPCLLMLLMGVSEMSLLLNVGVLIRPPDVSREGLKF